MGGVQDVTVYLGITPTEYSTYREITIENQSSPYTTMRSPFFADLNSDGLTDIIVALSSYYGDDEENVRYLENTGTATVPDFDDPVEIELSHKVRCIVEVADFNGNGHNDLLATTHPADLMVFTNLGDESFSGGESVPACDPSIYDNIFIFGSAADFDDDGVKEIVLTQPGDYPAGERPIILCQSSGMGIESSDALSGLGLRIEQNPSCTAPSLSMNLQSDERVSITVYTIDGRVVNESGAVSYPAGSNTVPLDITGMQKGVYLIRAVLD